MGARPYRPLELESLRHPLKFGRARYISDLPVPRKQVMACDGYAIKWIFKGKTHSLGLSVLLVYHPFHFRLWNLSQTIPVFRFACFNHSQPVGHLSAVFHPHLLPQTNRGFSALTPHHATAHPPVTATPHRLAFLSRQYLGDRIRIATLRTGQATSRREPSRGLTSIATTPAGPRATSLAPRWWLRVAGCGLLCG